MSRAQVAGVALAVGAAVMMGLGFTATANAAVLGVVTNFAPAYVYDKPTPTRADIERVTGPGMRRACQDNGFPATRYASLVSWTQSGPGAMVTSRWNCNS